MRILAQQPIQLVQHRPEAIDDVIGLRCGGPQPWQCDLVDFPDGRSEQVGLVRKIVIQTAAGHRGGLGDLSNGRLGVPHLGHAAHGRGDYSGAGPLAAGARGATQLRPPGVPAARLRREPNINRSHDYIRRYCRLGNWWTGRTGEDIAMARAQLGRPAGASGEETRQRIIVATMRCVATAGYSRATIREIARTAEVTSASLYNYFPNKSELIKAAVAARTEVALPRLRQAAGRPGGVIDRIEAVLDESGRLMREYPDLAAFEWAIRAEGAIGPQAAGGTGL